MAKYPLSPDVFLGSKWLYSGGLGAKYSPPLQMYFQAVSYSIQEGYR